jgi:hypothetical protein
MTPLPSKLSEVSRRYGHLDSCLHLLSFHRPFTPLIFVCSIPAFSLICKSFPVISQASMRPTCSRLRAQQGPKATRYRKGACANCGAMTHKRVDCLERPRKLGAQYTGKNIAADEYIPVREDCGQD